MHDPLEQRLSAQDLVFSVDGTVLEPCVFRYVWPAELDLIARVAGLRLRERWGDWNGSPFTADSRTPVSVYGR